jgi:hypothetical protein
MLALRSGFSRPDGFVEASDPLIMIRVKGTMAVAAALARGRGIDEATRERMARRISSTTAVYWAEPAIWAE